MWITILEAVAIIVIIFIAGLLALQTKIITTAEYLIGQAEYKDKTGAEKMAWVVDEIFTALWPVAQVWFTKVKIEVIAQSIYDRVKVLKHKKD